MKLLSFFHFKHVFDKSNRVKCKEFIILEKNNALTFPRLGISISKKNIQYSHERNQIKRIIRESFRLIQHKLINSDFVVIVGSYSTDINRKLLVKKLENLWIHYYQ
ncbi:MAG: ribonuclease P protein component [Buchnera aphidicola (Meitanaphis elongallis)]